MLSRKVKLVSSAMPIRLLTWIIGRDRAIRAGNVYLRIKFMGVPAASGLTAGASSYGEGQNGAICKRKKPRLCIELSANG